MKLDVGIHIGSTWFYSENRVWQSGIRAVSTVGRKPRKKWLLPKVCFTIKIIPTLSLTFLINTLILWTISSLSYIFPFIPLHLHLLFCKCLPFLVFPQTSILVYIYSVSSLFLLNHDHISPLMFDFLLHLTIFLFIGDNSYPYFVIFLFTTYPFNHKTSLFFIYLSFLVVPLLASRALILWTYPRFWFQSVLSILKNV
jgi:hypothetical protein